MTFWLWRHSEHFLQIYSCPAAFSPAPGTACDTPLEVRHSGHVPLAMCRVRESGETEAKCFASLMLQMPKSRDWHFPVALPLGGVIQGCAACWAAAMSSSTDWNPPAEIYVFQTPSGGRESAKKSCWRGLDALQKDPKTPRYSLFMNPMWNQCPKTVKKQFVGTAQKLQLGSNSSYICHHW